MSVPVIKISIYWAATIKQYLSSADTGIFHTERILIITALRSLWVGVPLEDDAETSIQDKQFVGEVAPGRWGNGKDPAKRLWRSKLW